MKKSVKIGVFSLLGVIGVLLLTVIIYVLYVVIQYDRIEDNVALTVENAQQANVRSDRTYTLMTYNVGFGAYGPDYSFFMDSGVMEDGRKVSGKYGKGISKASVRANTDGSLEVVREADCDFVFLQEVDEDGSRSYHINQRAAFSAIDGYAAVYAENFHSAYLFYPFNDPHGKNKAGVLSLTKYAVDSAVRRSYPVSGGFAKFFDLDRCFSVSYLPIADSDKQLVLINSHMSAYDEGGKIRVQQLAMLNEVLQEERDKGNYVIAGGDFNHDIAASKTIFPCKQRQPGWIYDLTDADLTEGFHIAAAVNAPTCRAAEIPYEKGVNHTVVVDGFIVSDNITVVSVENKDLDFAYSDHNPAVLQFRF